ncbi:hypothetical protein ANRL1_01172 [Anaerolineae bacterium]|nr:hypothetical protein ANRL1_01172 [Anaerolineae bacterium]
MVHVKLAWGRIAWYGAELGIAFAFVYALAFIVYAIVRATIDLIATPQIDAGWLNIALATWFSLAVPALLLAALFTPVVAIIGALTALGVNAIASARNASPRQAALIGAETSGVFALALIALLTFGAGFTWSLAIIETWMFWLVLPLLLYVVAGGVGGWMLSRMKSNLKE